ncbi:MAG TPA: PqqD family protein [Pyrinomonadaceae bacterium]|jgi:hypothetical protein
MSLKNHYARDATLLVVEEHLTVYLIPPMEAPRRLNHSASEIWRLIEAGHDLDGVSRRYAEAFACGRDEADADVQSFVASMTEQGFLHQVEE